MNTDFYKSMLSQLNDTQPYQNATPMRTQSFDPYPMFTPALAQQESVEQYLGLSNPEVFRPQNDFGGYESAYENPLNQNLDQRSTRQFDESTVDMETSNPMAGILQSANADTAAYDPFGEY